MIQPTHSSTSSQTIVNKSVMTTIVKDYIHKRVEFFNPAWFAAVMGIGISSVILYSFPFNSKWLRILGIIIWGFNMGFFAIANLLFICKYIIRPTNFVALLHHPDHSVFLGCYPMGLATIINMTDLIFGHRAWKATYAMWWLDVFFSLFSAWIVVFCMYAKHDRQTVEKINATILLPVVALVVASSTGALITANLPKTLHQSTIIISALLWGNGELLGFTCIVIYVNRLLSRNLPPSQMSISNFLPLGPLGQGSFGIIIITSNLATLLEEDNIINDASVIKMIRYAGLAIALVMMGYGCFWVFIAFMSIALYPPKSFNPGWWGLTFPLGTFVLGWFKLGEETGLLAFRLLGAIFGVLEVLLALLCVVETFNHAVFHDTLFRPPPEQLPLTDKESV